MSIEEQIVKNYAKLNETDLCVWNFIKENKKKVQTLTIDQLASETAVSRTTISRFVRKIGFGGYSEFKFRIGLEQEQKGSHKFANIYEDACNTIIQYIEQQRHKDYTKICRLIAEANRKFVYGTGDIQNAVAKQLKRMFMSVKEIIYDVGGTTFDKTMFDVMEEGDLIILISLSGNNTNCLNVARNAKLKGVKVIAITEFKDNELVRVSDAALYISATPFSFLEGHPDYKLTMIYFTLVELLFIKYATYIESTKGI